jgi:hypothetical protein
MIPNNISLPFYKACKNKKAEGIDKNLKYIYVPNCIILDPNDQILMN